MAPRFVDRQLSHPNGLGGLLIALLMNRTNAKMNAYALRQLDIAPKDRVLEIGFGGGVNLPTLIERAAFAAGLDRSADMVARARKQYAAAVASGRAEFREGSVDALPFAANAFEKVCTVNTVYFWPSLAGGFAEIHRVLAPSGRLAVGFLPKERMERIRKPVDIFTLRTTDEVIAAVRGAGFTNARVERPEPMTPWNVVVAGRAN